MSSYLGVAAISDIYVRDKASKFCNAFADGDMASSLVAIAVQAKVIKANEQLNIRRDSVDSVIVEFAGLTPFDGYACSMTIKNERVVSKKYLELL